MTRCFRSGDRSDREFGLHPSLPNVRDMYNAGNAAMIANVGALVQPTTLKNVKDKKNLPLGLYSHSDLQQHWQTAVPQDRANLIGWAGRVADCLTDASNTNEAVSMSFGLNRSPLMLSGRGVIPYVVGNKGATTLDDYNDAGSDRGRIITRGTDAILRQAYTNLLQQTHATRRRKSIDAAIDFNRATQNVELDTDFPSSSLGKQLSMVARIISAHKRLGQKRQIFFVSRGGFDNHNELINNQRNSLSEFDAATNAFYKEMGRMRLSDRVTNFYCFGLRENVVLQWQRYRPRLGQQPHRPRRGRKRWKRVWTIPKQLKQTRGSSRW